MLSVILVDDEIAILELIKHLIDYELNGVELLGCCADAQEAKRLILEKKPDVVITDIRMPKLSGLDLIGQTREFCPGTQYLVVSGYSDFEYAQSALRLGAVDYLLKPINCDELNQQLTQIRCARAQQQMEHQQSQHIRQRLKKSNSELRKSILQSCLAGSSDWLTDRFRELFSVECRQFCIIEIKIDCRNATSVPLQFQISEDTMETICRKYIQVLEQGSTACEYVFNNSRADVFLGFQEISREEFEELCRQLSELLKNETYRNDMLSVTIGFGSLETSLSSLQHSRDVAALALCRRISVGLNHLIHVEHEDEITYPVPHELVKRIIAPLLRMSRKEMSDAVYDTLLNINHQDTAFRAYRFCEVVLREGNNTFGGILPPAELEQALCTISHCTTVRMLAQHLVYYLSLMMDNYEFTSKYQEPKTIRAIKRYVMEHYYENINLDVIAQTVFLNPIYISAYFKKETGMSFSNYVRQVRIDHAKELLRDTQLGISDIASHVGYSDEKYFSRLFQKSVGIKPSDFRRFFS